MSKKYEIDFTSAFSKDLKKIKKKKYKDHLLTGNWKGFR